MPTTSVAFCSIIISCSLELQGLFSVGFKATHCLCFTWTDALGCLCLPVPSAEIVSEADCPRSPQDVVYGSNTPEDPDRQAFHEGVISSDLAGQREFAWGEILHLLGAAANKDWLVIAYSREPKVPLPEGWPILTLLAHEWIRDDDI